MWRFAWYTYMQILRKNKGTKPVYNIASLLLAHNYLLDKLV